MRTPSPGRSTRRQKLAPVVGASSVFEIQGRVVPTAVAGEFVVSEVEVTYANDPFGPAFPLRDGTAIEVVAPEPTFTG